MKNKFMAMILAIVTFAISIPAAVSAARAQDVDIIDFMNKMEFISESEIAGDKLNSPITRMDFALFVARILGIDEAQTSDKDYFYDVPQDHWGKFCINSLAERGILTTEDRSFRPNDIISKSEAARIVITCIGKNGEADRRGGYPSGYLSVASEEKLFQNFNSGSELTYKNAAVLLYNMINAEITQMSISAGDKVFSAQGETILSFYYDIYLGEGQINAVYGASVDESEAFSEDDIVINSEHYYTDEWLYNYLGMNVDYYYKDVNGEKSVVYVFSDDKNKNETVSFTSEDYDGFDNGSISYFIGDKSKKVKIYSGAAVIKNGEDVSGDLKNALSEFYGYIRIIDTGRFDGADIIIIEDYIDIAVSHSDSKDMIVYDKYDPMNAIDLSEENGEVIKYFRADGEKTDFSAIVKDNVISVAAAKDRSFVLVKIHDENIAGEITSKGYSDTNDAFLEISGQMYGIRSDFYEKFTDVFLIGESGTFKTGLFGKIAYFSMDKGDEMRFAYLINAFISDEFEGVSLDSERVILKIFSEDGETLKIPCAQKVRIDAVQCNSCESIYDKISDDKGVISQIVRLKYDKNGYIKVIDTKNYNYAEGKYSLRRQENEKNLYRHWTGLIGQNAYVTGNTKVFVVPPEGQEKTAEDSEFMIKTIGYIPSGTSSRIDLFQLDPDSLDIDLVVYYANASDSISTYAPMYVVEKVNKSINADNEPVKSFTLDSVGSNSEYLVSPNYVIEKNSTSRIDPDEIDVGDIIRIKTNYKNEISNIQLVFDYSKAIDAGNSAFFENSMNSAFKIADGIIPGNFFDGFKLSYGYVARTSGNSLQWGYAKPGDGDETYNVGIESGTTKILIFDEEDKTDKCKLGSISDIVGFYQSSGKYSKIVTLSRSAVMSQIIVYK